MFFFVLEREEIGKTNDNWNFWILFKTFVGPKRPFRDAYVFLSLLKPYFYSGFRVRAFWAKLSKREILDTHPKKEKFD